MVKKHNSLYFKLVAALFVCLGLLMSVYAWYQCRQIRSQVENDLEAKGLALAKAAAKGLEAMIQNDISKGVVSEATLFDRNYKLLIDDPDSTKRKFVAAFTGYTDKYWQNYVDSFLVDDDVVFAAPVAYSKDPQLNGYLPTHNTKYKDRSRRIFNDPTGALAAASTREGYKQVYKRDTGEVMWDVSYPIYINGKHWGGYRVAISIVKAEEKIAAAQNKTLIYMTGILLVITLILLVVTKLIVGRPLERILSATGNLASGEADLTQRLAVSSKDELGLLARQVNLFIEKIHNVTREVAESVNSVTETSDNLSLNAEEMAKASQSVAASIEEMVKGANEKLGAVSHTREIVNEFTAASNQIANGAQDQADHVNKTSSTIGQMAEAIQEVASSAQMVLNAATDAANVARKGEGAVDSTISGMERIKNTVYESAVKIKELGEHSHKIGEIIRVIDDIAEQTNLLALNAAIEAARAGDHGKGFAVVADEVRKLAERSGKATKEIAVLIENIQKGTENAVKAMEQGTQEVTEGVVLAHDAGAALEEIMKTVEQTLIQIRSISEAAKQMSEASTSVVKDMDNVAAITQQNSAATQQMAVSSDSAISAIDSISTLTQNDVEHAESVSVSVEEMTASTEGIASSAEALSEMAHDLRALVGGFKI